MIITKIRIENLKCFKNFSLPLGGLTLLTGLNAAGKSTSAQSILLLSQALKRNSKDWVLPLNGPLAQLGNVGDALHEGAEGNLILGVETDLGKIDWIFAPGGRSFPNALLLENIEWTDESNSGNFDKSFGDLDSLLPSPRSITLSNIVNVVRDAIFISAMRHGIEDIYPVPFEVDPNWADVGSRGEFAAWWLDQQGDEDICPLRARPEDEALTLRRQINAWLGILFPGAQANATKIPNTDLMQLSLRNHETDSWRRPANIGYGLSYSLPILVAGLLAKKGQILIIDSPEAHLHPTAQSNIGRFLAVIASAGVQVIVETHSDHVLNGVRRAVFEKSISPDAIRIHFFSARPRSADDRAHVTSPKIDEAGNLSEWPPGFFDQAEQDMIVLAGWGN
jgi:predicted ATPase